MCNMKDKSRQKELQKQVSSNDTDPDLIFPFLKKNFPFVYFVTVYLL